MKNKPDIFNILRCIALFCVLGVHSKIVIGDANPSLNFPWYIYTPAWAAMWMFFTLSGYLLGKGFYNEKYKTETLDGVKQFYISRFIRIAPSYYLFIFLIFCFVNPVWFATIDFKYVLRLITFTYNGDGNPGIPGIGALWFISTVVQCYVLAPFIYEFLFKKLNRKQSFWLFCGIVFLGLALRYYGRKIGYSSSDIYSSTITNLDCFFAGMLFNAITKDCDDSKIRKGLRPFSLLFLLGFITVNTWFYANNLHMDMYRYRYPTVYILLFCMVFYAFDVKNRIRSTPLSLTEVAHNPLRLFDCMAAISYGMYLYHSNLLSVVPRILNATQGGGGHFLSISILAGGTICAVSAIINYYAIEKPCNVFRKKDVVK